MARDSKTTAWLAPGIHMAWVGEDVVVLSIPGDGYSCLVGAGRHFHQTGNGEVQASNPAVLDDLEAAGLVTRAARTVQDAAPLPARQELEPSVQPRLALRLQAAASAVRGHAAFQTLSFPQLIAAARACKRNLSSPDPAPSAAAVAAVDAFTAVLPWLPFEGLCLHRAFLLVRYLAGEGVAARWVFGVRTWPFAAHCWVQIGDTVLADRLTRVGVFTPILVV